MSRLGPPPLQAAVRLRDDRRGVLGAIFQTSRLLRLIVRNRLPRSNVLSLAALFIIVSFFTVVINFIGADERRMAAPLLDRVPHAFYSAEDCEEFSSDALDKHMRNAGLSAVASACVKTAQLSLIRYKPSPPGITGAQAVAFTPRLFPVLPGLAEFRTSLRRSDLDKNCSLAGLSGKAGAADLLDGAITVSGCDRTGRSLPMALVSRTFAEDADLAPGQAVTIFPGGLVFNDLRRYLADTVADDPGDHIIAGIVPMVLPQPRNVIFVPEHALDDATNVRDMVIVRALHAPDLATLRRIMKAVDEHFRTLSGVSMTSSILEDAIWEAERNLKDLLWLLRTATMIMVLAVSVQAANLYVQSERRLFSVARISGFTDSAIFLTICLVMTGIFLVIALLGFGVGTVLCELVVRYLFKKMTYLVAAGTFWQILLAIGAASLIGSLIVMKRRFARDIATEFQDVNINA